MLTTGRAIVLQTKKTGARVITFRVASSFVQRKFLFANLARECPNCVTCHCFVEESFFTVTLDRLVQTDS